MARELLDLGAGVSILLGSLYDQYDLGPLIKADTTVVLANLTLKLPRGIVTDVIVMIEDIFYPIDFLGLDYVTFDPKRQLNVNLGRPFLEIANALINFEIINGLNPHENEEDTTEECVMCCRSTVEHSHQLDKEEREDEIYIASIGNRHGLNRSAVKHSHQLEKEEREDEIYVASIGKPPWSQQVEKLPDIIDYKLRPSLESPPVVELKELSKHLKYVFLGENDMLPAIITSNLDED
ncbi:uncharacterized protein LOC143560550 [Bidens hawaiensis]|uniref:uncharacterized protein LOC143560550 n=1 Tax=Bidens hawaiensis TaxID=980011 RepID=UPI00404B3049